RMAFRNDVGGLYAEGTSGRKVRPRRKIGKMSLRRAIAGTVALFAAASVELSANPASIALRAKATNQIYNLDRDEALATFREATEADAEDAAACGGLATSLWLSITFRRGNMTVDDYVGRVTKPSGPAAPAPPETVAAFRTALEKATALARARLARNPRDADA